MTKIIIHAGMTVDSFYAKTVAELHDRYHSYPSYIGRDRSGVYHAPNPEEIAEAKYYGNNGHAAGAGTGSSKMIA